MKRTAATLAIASITSLAACITVNIYFPAPEVRAAAEEIVEETWGSGPSVEEPRTPKKGASVRDRIRRTTVALAGRLGPREAAAQQADINVSTAAIRALKESMKERASALKPHLSEGRLGLGKDGMLVVRELGGLPLREQAEVRRLLDAENRDRRSLYREIAKANDFGDDRIDDIQGIFAETWREKAERGWWVQENDGGWSRR